MIDQNVLLSLQFPLTRKKKKKEETIYHNLRAAEIFSWQFTENIVPVRKCVRIFPLLKSAPLSYS